MNRSLTIAALLLVSFAIVSFPQGKGDPASQKRPRLARPQQPGPETPVPQPTESPAQPDEVIRVETNLVTTLFTVMDHENHFVTALRRDDVRILEDGAPQPTEIFQRETDLPLSLAVMVDVSQSQERTLPDEKRAANEFIKATLRPEVDRVAAVSFNGKATVDQELSNVSESLLGAINRMKVELPPNDPECKKTDVPVETDPRCWTSIWDSVWATANELLSHTSEHSRRAMILITDGYDTSSFMKMQEAIDEAVRNNVIVYGVGFTDPKEYDVDEGALRKMAERTGGRAFFPRNDAELRAAFTQIQQELRSQYLIAYSPRNSVRDGRFHQTRIEIINPALRNQKLRLFYRQGYYEKR